MTVVVHRLPDLATVILENNPPLQVPEDPITNMHEAAALKHELGRPVYRIIDLLKVDIDFSDMMLAMGAELGKEGGSDDPDVTTIFVGSGEMVELGTKALKEQSQYGKGRVFLFRSQEEALEFVRVDLNE